MKNGDSETDREGERKERCDKQRGREGGMKKEGQGARQTKMGKEKYNDRLGDREGRLRKTGTGRKTERDGERKK